MENINAVHGHGVLGNARQHGVAPLDEGGNNDRAALPLRLAREGDRVRIVSLNGGRGFHDRLAGVGLRVGERVEVIRNRMDGKLLLAHEGTRLFLGGGMAQKIQVVVVEGGDL
ncbi:MAG: ferrous iron transport protein A [Deltaproteobacteria bacterium]|nr:ferrous iron transport protein A [Deltaproteobacteria bacterium]